tara:strand:- start:9167 stop:11956 length:2790 start_codon:yes stop_codon:yes gene_type:complete
MLQELEFQCISWYAKDVSLNADSDSETESETEKRYQISIFGRTNECASVCVHTFFNPYFFVEIPDHWKNQDVAKFQTALKREMRQQQDSLKSINIVERKKFYGFTNFKTFKFVRIIFGTHQGYKRAMYILKKPLNNMKFTMYEANIDPMLRFAHIQDIQMAGWIRIEKKKFSELKLKKHYVTNEYFVSSWRDVCASTNQSIAPIVQASFDIETYSHDGGFPDPHDKGCPVIQIATTLQRFGEATPYKRSLLSLGTCDHIENVENVELQCFETESQLLEAWGKLVRGEDIDILIGYNIWGFDLWYLHVRATMCDAVDFFELGRVIGKESELKAASFSSCAYGDSDYQMVDTLGRFQIDLLVIMKREHKLTSYSLNAVSAHFLKDKKVDMPYKLMFEKYKGTSADRAEIAIYCIKDTDLPLALINKLAIVPNMVEMSKATWVPMSYLIERGQGIKVFSQILYQTRHEDMLVLTLNKTGNEVQEAYEGATVLQAMKGAYMDTPITGLDFASLYPTIMRAHKLCHSTYVNDAAYDNIDGVEYITVDNHRFAQNSEGILPKMLRQLATNRKLAKKEMAKAEASGDKFLKAVYNGKQLAFKVSMNSIYGFCGALVGFLPCKPVASCTTSIGRGMIDHTKRLVEEWYPGATVVYGDTDSVMVRFDTGKERGQKALEKSFELGIEAAERISATFKAPIELEFEKVYWPYLLFSKKRYAGLMYTNPQKPDYIDAKGIQLVRRDNCPFVKRISQEVLDTIMYKMDTEGAIKIVQAAAKELLSYNVLCDDLVVSKSLRRISYVKNKREIPPAKSSIQCNGFHLVHEYKNANLPHLVVAAKHEERESGSGPKSGDRVPYVFIDTGNPKDLQYTKAEDPVYVKTNKIKLDVVYYLEHALKNPLESLFELFLDDPQDTLFAEALNGFKAKKNTSVDIYEFLGI